MGLCSWSISAFAAECLTNTQDHIILYTPCAVSSGNISKSAFAPAGWTDCEEETSTKTRRCCPLLDTAATRWLAGLAMQGQLLTLLGLLTHIPP